MPRLTRQESRQLTRQKLIETAAVEISRVGIYEASIRMICEAAGFTLGAFYSNFMNKDELLLEVVEQQTKKEFMVLGELVATLASRETHDALARIAEWLRALQQNKIFSDLVLEFEVYANHNSSFKTHYDDNKRRWQAEIATALSAFFEGQGLTPRIAPPLMAVGLLALWRGFAMEGTVSEVDSVDKVIMVFLESMLESSRH
jgi:AcrR family transcriptional regulator